MIVDCYTHVWDSPAQLGRLADSCRVPLGASALTVPANTLPDAGPVQHRAARQPVDVSIVLAFRSEYLGVEISNDDVAGYVQTDPERLIGYAGIDPSRPTQAADEMDRALTELGMKGIALSPAAQDLHPCHSKVDVIYERAAEAGIPIIFHPGIQTAPECVLEYAQPVLLDAVAREYPSLKIVVAHLGYPWVKETLLLLAKHDNAYSEISWLMHRPWEAYQALLNAHQCGVMDKLLFGSGFPYGSPTQSIEALYGINHLCAGTNLPGIPREVLRGIVERDALTLLGIEHVSSAARSRADTVAVDVEGELD